MLSSGQTWAPTPLQITSLTAQQMAMPQLSLLLHIATPLSLNLNNFNLDSSDGLISAKQPVLVFSSHLASDTEVKNEETKGVLHCVWFSTPSSCATFKQTRQNLAPTLCAVLVTQKVVSDLPHLFCMQLKASQISWFPKAPRAPTLICFRVGFLIVLGFFSAAISSHTHLTSPFMEQLFILFHTRTGHQPFLLSGYCGSTSAGY